MVCWKSGNHKSFDSYFVLASYTLYAILKLMWIIIFMLDIKNPPLEIEVDGDKVSNFKRTLKSSGIHRHSFIIL